MIMTSENLVGQLTDLAYGRSSPTVTVGVHDGTMHPDEVCAVAVLAEHLPGDINIRVIRSRDPALLRHADVLFDVSIWPDESPFDHHGKDLQYYPNGIPYSTLGHVLDAVEPNRSLRELLLFNWGYAIQANDNGFYRLPKGIEQSKMRWMTSLNQTWQENLSDAEAFSRFNWAVDVTRVIYRRMRAQALAKLAAGSILERCPLYMDRFVELPPGGCPWQSYAFKNPNILGEYHRDINGLWTVRVAKEGPGDSSPRVQFPIEWGGKEQKDLQVASGIPDAFFCHRSLHMGTFRTINGAKHAMRILIAIHDNQS